MTIIELENKNRELHKKLRELEEQQDSIKKLIVKLTSWSIGSFSNIAMPLIKRTMPKLISDDLVGVQPMFQPKGLVDYLKYKGGEESDSKITLPDIDTLVKDDKITKDMTKFITDKRKKELVKKLIRNEQKWFSIHDL